MNSRPPQINVIWPYWLGNGGSVGNYPLLMLDERSGSGRRRWLRMLGKHEHLSNACHAFVACLSEFNNFDPPTRRIDAPIEADSADRMAGGSPIHGHTALLSARLHPRLLGPTCGLSRQRPNLIVLKSIDDGLPTKVQHSESKSIPRPFAMNLKRLASCEHHPSRLTVSFRHAEGPSKRLDSEARKIKSSGRTG